jgi:hypothetical protein
MMSTTFQGSSVETVVKRGWRRRLLVLAVDQSAIVLALVLAGLSLLIVLGTQILAWQWLLFLAGVGTALAIYGVRRRMADAYQVAQMMDEHLALNDSLSTAWFLKTKPAESGAAADFQLMRAEELARAADPAAAFPFERRRAWVVTAVLFALAFGLFSARYLVTRQLSLQHTFLPLAVTQVFEYVRHGGAKADRDGRQQAGGLQEKVVPPGVLGPDGKTPNKSANAEQGQKAGQSPADGAAEKNENAPGQNAQQAKAGEGKSGDQKRNGEQSSAQNGQNQEAGKDSTSGDKQDAQNSGQQKSSSMMDRMRDALSSVMSKLKPQSSKTPQQASQKSSDGQKGDNEASNKDQKGEGQKDGGKEQSAQEQNSGEQQGQGAAKSQASQGKDSAQSSDKKGSDAQSGVGHSDGDKELKAAEQAKAMGKLAEIIGKRSASLTGDMQIEPSGKQRLQTDYTHQTAQHADLGGEINRDEVPVEDQEYVREYMELVRKKPAKATAPK